MSTATATADADQPWEDTLILAFRDIQWILHNEEQERLISKTIDMLFLTKRPFQNSPGDFYKMVKEAISSEQENRVTTPPLLAKLDGKAESAAGDVLTANHNRFFLIEFKADIRDRSSEYAKFLGVMMWLIDPDDYDVLISRSKKGHFFLTQSTDTCAPELPNVRHLSLDAYTYYEIIATQSPVNLPTPVSAHDLLTNKRYGLTLAAMADYLRLLCELHVSDSAGGAHPMKVAVASTSGVLWPISDLSQLAALAQFFNTSAPPSASVKPALSRSEVMQLRKLYDAFLKKTPDQQKRALERTHRTPGKKTPGGS